MPPAGAAAVVAAAAPAPPPSAPPHTKQSTIVTLTGRVHCHIPAPRESQLVVVVAVVVEAVLVVGRCGASL